MEPPSLTRRRVLSVGGSSYVIIPKALHVKPKETVILAYTEIAGFILGESSRKLDSTGFRKQLDALYAVLVDAHALMRDEGLEVSTA